MNALVAEASANIKNDFKLGIKTQWKNLDAANSIEGLDKFSILWTKYYKDCFVKITDDMHQSAASLELIF